MTVEASAALPPPVNTACSRPHTLAPSFNPCRDRGAFACVVLASGLLGLPDMPLALLKPFRQQPLYALACTATLALAVAAAATSVAVVKRALFDPLPFADADRLVSVLTAADTRTVSTSVFVFDDLRNSAPSPLTDVTALRFSTATYQGAESAESVEAHEILPSYFDTFGVRPMLGQTLPADDPNAVVISARFWRQALGGAPDVVGHALVIDGISRHVVGVMPEAFYSPFGVNVDFFTPLNLRVLLTDTARARRTISVFARLAPGVTSEQAGAFMETFSQGQRDRFPTIHARERWVLQPLRETLVGASRPVILGTGAAAALLMLIVCANIAGLSAVNAAAHRQHYAIRTALGASAARLFTERLRDSLIISTAGSVAGLWLAYALIAVAARYQQHFLPLLATITFDPATALAGLGLGAAIGVVAALAPLGAIARLQVDDPLRAARGTTADRRLTAIRSALVIVQVAVAIVLMVGAGLLVKTVANLSATALGYESARLGYFHVTLPYPRYRESATHVQFERDLLQRVTSIPGVTGASASVGFPVMGSMGARLTILKRPDPTAAPDIAYYSVSPQFFSFLDVPILAGRDIAATDDFPAPRVVVINETMARLFWPDGDAIGATVKIGAGAATDREITIVGIAADVRQNGPTQDVRPTAYGSTLQYSWPRRHIALRTDRPIASLAKEVRAAVFATDPSVSSTTVRAIDQVVENQTARHRLVMLTLTLFGTVATVLCAFGLYATVALNSQFRRREYAIRVALGSTRTRVWWLVIRQALVLALIGGVAGVLLASSGTETIESLLHGVGADDRFTFGLSFVAMVSIAALSASLPALKAGRVDPVEALKSE
jgi:putative ABC transport system permease protein